jgi:hypothetical protein
VGFYYGWGGAILLVQVLCIVHAIRSGRSSWIWIIFFFPLVGSIVYVISEVRVGRAGQRLAGQIVDVVQPSRRLGELRAKLDECPSVENRMELAGECARQRQFTEAIQLYRDCLSGVHADDPAALKLLAAVQLDSGAFADAKETLERLFRTPRERTPAARLLFARALEGTGDDTATLAAYEDARAGAIGDEARARHALFLDKLGRTEDARAIWERIAKEASRADGRYRRDNREWIRIAKDRLAQDERASSA